jgi:hypothetical protein
MNLSRLILLAAIGAAAAIAQPVTYQITFTGSALNPSSGSFTYDSSLASNNFTSFTVTWNSTVLDLASAANSPIIMGGTECGTITTAAAFFSALTNPASICGAGAFTEWQILTGGIGVGISLGAESNDGDDVIIARASGGAPRAFSEYTGSYTIQPITYNITFTGSALNPTYGSFTFDFASNNFTAFTVTWNSNILNLASAANSPSLEGRGTECGTITTPVALFSALTNPTSICGAGALPEWEVLTDNAGIHFSVGTESNDGNAAIQAPGGPFGASQALSIYIGSYTLQAAPVLYTINFTTTSGVAPTSGSFDYDSSQPVGSQFTNFFVSWDGSTFNLTPTANSPYGTPSGDCSASVITFLTTGSDCTTHSNGRPSWIAEIDGPGTEQEEFDFDDEDVTETHSIDIFATIPIPESNVFITAGGTWTATAVPAPAPGTFVPITPCRIADTRYSSYGSLGPPSLVGGATRSFAILSSSCSIPTTAEAYSLNVTVVPKGPLDYLTVWPSGAAQPLVSTLNSVDGRIKANAAIIPAGAGGAVSVYATNATDVILDIDGYFLPATDNSGLAFYPLTPCRVADTRYSSFGSLGPPSLSAGQSRSFAVLSSNCNVPSTAQAYSMNFTVVPHGTTPVNYITTYPTGATQPVASTLNDDTGTVVANAAIVPAGTGGAVSVYSYSATDLLIDIDGYFAPPGIGGLSLYNVTPCRVLDSRLPVPSTRPFTGELDVSVTTNGCGVPATAQAYVFNATVVPPGPMNYLTLWPQGGTQPVVSTLNALDGAITSNMALVPTTNGSISSYVYVPSTTYLILDIFGYFAP